MKYLFGADIGGTTVKLGFFEENGTLIDKWEIKTNRENCGASVPADICAAVRAKMSEKNLKDYVETYVDDICENME